MTTGSPDAEHRRMDNDRSVYVARADQMIDVIPLVVPYRAPIIAVTVHYEDGTARSYPVPPAVLPLMQPSVD